MSRAECCDCPQAEHQHGDWMTRKKHKCDCDACTLAAFRRRKDTARGVRTLVDAEPVRRHIRLLQQSGMTNKSIADLASVHPRTVWTVADTSQPTMQKGKADAILAVRPIDEGMGRLDATGTRRRIQALYRIGWSMGAIEKVSGVSDSTIAMVLTGNEVVAAHTARGIEVAYDRLWNREPPRQTVHERRLASRNRNKAERLGWAPPLAWDDDTIDDPDAKPQGVGVDRFNTPATTEAQWRMALGEPLEAVARDLGVAAEYLARRMKEAA